MVYGEGKVALHIVGDAFQLFVNSSMDLLHEEMRIVATEIMKDDGDHLFSPLL